MKLKDIMTVKVHTVAPATSLSRVAELMKEHDIGCVPVVEDSSVRGMITDRDIVVRTLAEGRNPVGCTAQEIMTPHADALPGDATIRQAVNLMEKEQIRRVLVLDEHNQLIGIVTVGDLAARAHDIAETGEILERICAPALLT